MIFDELRAIQHEHGYLPAEQLHLLSKRMHIPLYQISGVAEFYPHFHLSPPPKVRVGVCTDMVCHLHGADRLHNEVKRSFAALEGRQVGVLPLSCLGQCDHAPAIAVNDVIYPGVTLDQAQSLVQTALAGFDLPNPHVAIEEVALESDPYQGVPKYGALRTLLETRDFDGVIDTLKAAGLGGMGGAGFPCGIKWDVVKKAPGSEKYIVCNADESEPGTIKDRFIMVHLPHLVIEGIIIGALVTGARKGFLYIRHEYTQPEQILRQEIERCKQEGLLGAKILGTDLSFDLEVFVSPGGYICGEGSAQLEAIEGKRAEPRNKPPNSATVGLWQKPTALNNVETFAVVPQILARGVEWFKAQGHGAASGLKFVGVSGDVQRPGVYEIKMGTPISEVILGLAGGPTGGKQVKAFAPSGAASGFLPASKMDTRLDFKSMAAAGTMLGSAALVVLAEGRCILDMALNAITFFRNESCGKCVPCRLGSQKMVDILDGWTHGKGTEADLQLVAELSETMKLTSICGLGQFVPYPVQLAIQHFREEVDAHIIEKRCPEKVCPMSARSGL